MCGEFRANRIALIYGYGTCHQNYHKAATFCLSDPDVSDTPNIYTIYAFITLIKIFDSVFLGIEMYYGDISPQILSSFQY